MSVLIGFVGLATDVGSLLYAKRLVQTAADAAAIGGATEVPYANVTTAARTDATKNGFTAGTVSTPNGSIVTTVTVNNPPLYGPHTGASNSNYVEVIVTQTEPVYFMRLFGLSLVKVTARAVAALQNGPGCLYAMNPSASGAIQFNGLLENVQAPDCAIYDNSNSSRALDNTGLLNTLVAKSIGIVGNYNPGFFSPGFPTPRPVTGITPVTDPLYYLAPPAIGACSTTSGGPFGNGTTNVLVNGTNPVTHLRYSTLTIPPGTYCGTGGLPAINIADPSHFFPGITFSPGVYVLNGGGLVIGDTASVTGLNVTFYLTNGASFNVAGFTFIALGAPTTGPYAGILFYQDPSDTAADTIGCTNCGSGSFPVTLMSLAGAIYLPKATLNFGTPGFVSSWFGGVGFIQLYNIMVVDKLSFNGFLQFTDYASLTGFSPIKGAVLAE
jgi:hypothetical protein